MIGFLYIAPGVPLDLTFDKAMDVGVIPALTSLHLVIDGTPEFPTGLAWQDAVTLRVVFAGVPAVSGVFEVLAADNNLRGLDGSVVKPAQTTVFFP